MPPCELADIQQGQSYYSVMLHKLLKNQGEEWAWNYRNPLDVKSG